ncbi:flavohemoglobin expression-modulating QEGLA motif protein [Actinomycetota bacterium]|nr:flavohemoglobin expression-modulating QEGLA motif protein [Micrococcales bacterium]
MSDADARGGLSVDSLGVDYALAQLSSSLRFLLDVTPLNAEDAREAFLADGREPEFIYRAVDTDPKVLSAVLDDIDLGRVEEPILAQLLRRKHRELHQQFEMIGARDTDDFLPLSIELYGGVSTELRETAERLIGQVTPPERAETRVDAQQFLALAESEIEHYRSVDPDIEMHAEIRPDVSGVLVSGNTLLIGPETSVDARRADALLQHEVGTHLVTQVNGAVQPIKTLGSGLAGYDETQEGLAVLAEIACGGLTSGRLRQLAARVVTVHRRTSGADFVEAHRALTEVGFPASAAFTTVMRVYRSGGLTKDAIYLRGVLDLLTHIRAGGELDLFFLGKFALEDLPLVEDLHGRGILQPATLQPRYAADPLARERLSRAAETTSLSELLEGEPA